MTISSSKWIIKSREESPEVKEFIPPAQTFTRPPRQGKQTETPEGGEEGSEAGFFEQPQAAGNEAEEAIDTARIKARQLMERANGLAEALLKEARAEAEEMKRKSVKEGFQEGYQCGSKEGFEKAMEEHGALLSQELSAFEADIKKALDSVAAAKERYLRNYLDELKDCSIAVAEKVIHVSLKSSGEIMKRMIVAATEKLKKTAWVKIYIEKADYEIMLEADLHVADELSKLSDNIKFIVMDKEERGNCIIEMPDEIVDISVDTQIENMKEILENIRL